MDPQSNSNNQNSSNSSQPNVANSLGQSASSAAETVHAQQAQQPYVPSYSQGQQQSVQQPQMQPEPAPQANAAYHPVAAPQSIDQFQHQAVNNHKKQKKKFKQLALIAGIFLVLFTGTAAAYFGYVVPNRPENKIAKSFGSLATIQKDGADMALNFQLSGKGANLGTNIAMTIPMSYDYDGEKLQFKIGVKDMNVETDAFSNIGGFDISAVDLNKIQLDSEFIINSADNKVYMKVTGLDSMVEVTKSIAIQSGASASEADDFGDVMKEMFNIIEDRWIVTDSDEEVSFDQFNQVIECLSSDNIDVSGSDIVDLYSKHKFLTVDNEPESVELRGIALTKYEVTINADKYIEFGNATDELLSNDQELNTCIEDVLGESFGEDSVDTGASDSEVDLDEDFSFSVWIDDEENIRQISFEIDEDEVAGLITLAMDFRDANQINVPLDAVAAETIEQEIDQAVQDLESELGSSSPATTSLSDPEIEARNTQRKDDALRLLAAMENYADDNFGKYPENKTEMQDAIVNHMSSQKFEDPSTGFAYSVEYTDDWPTRLGEMSYSASAYCSSFDFITPTTSPDSSSIAVEVYLEQDFFCIDNQ